MTFDYGKWYEVMISFRTDLKKMGIDPAYLTPARLERGINAKWPLKPARK